MSVMLVTDKILLYKSHKLESDEALDVNVEKVPLALRRVNFMTWTYSQSTGDLFHNGIFHGTGYSGKGQTLAEGRNNGEVEDKARIGPIPRGRWKIGNPVNKKTTGPISISLTPVGHDAHGRSGFFIHGDNTEHNASIGCIILARAIRLEIVGSGDTELEVSA